MSVSKFLCWNAALSSSNKDIERQSRIVLRLFQEVAELLDKSELPHHGIAAWGATDSAPTRDIAQR